MFVISLAVTVLGVNTISADRVARYDSYVDEGIATQTDNGDAMILLGVNDSTATILELVSDNNAPTVTFMMMEDSSLVKVDSTGKPVVATPAHKLNLKK